MARGITQDQVTQAADALLSRGERPTIEKVRSELGTGSPNTLLRMLEIWWAELAKRLAAQARAHLPGIPDAVQRAMMTLWSEAVVETRHEAKTQYEERELGLAAREAALEDQLEQNAALAEVNRHDLDQALRDLDLARAYLANERRRADDLQQSLAASLQSLCEAQSTTAALRLAGDDAQKTFRLDKERADATEQRWLREVDRAREDAKAARHEEKIAQAKLATEAKLRRKIHDELEVQKGKSKRQIVLLERQLKAYSSQRTLFKTKKKTAIKRKRAER